MKLLLAGGAAFTPGLAALGAVKLDDLRGDRVGWARLKTPGLDWQRHAGADPMLTTFFHDKTTLNIEQKWYVADANNLDALCHFPFMFSQSLAPITEEASRKNIAEFIRRGGFVLVDACHDIHVTRTSTNSCMTISRFIPQCCPRRKSCHCRRRMTFTGFISRFPMASLPRRS